MTREEFNLLEPGMKCLIGNTFFEDQCDELEEFLGTIQIVERIEHGGRGWIYFKDLPQPFAMSEVARVVYDHVVIDCGDSPYDHGDIGLIFGGV